jgi:hypothetical protein
MIVPVFFSRLLSQQKPAVVVSLAVLRYPPDDQMELNFWIHLIRIQTGLSISGG